jgi:hypothetical protein
MPGWRSDRRLKRLGVGELQATTRSRVNLIRSFFVSVFKLLRFSWSIIKLADASAMDIIRSGSKHCQSVLYESSKG